MYPEPPQFLTPNHPKNLTQTTLNHPKFLVYPKPPQTYPKPAHKNFNVTFFGVFWVPQTTPGHPVFFAATLKIFLPQTKRCFCRHIKKCPTPKHPGVRVRVRVGHKLTLKKIQNQPKPSRGVNRFFFSDGLTTLYLIISSTCRVVSRCFKSLCLRRRGCLMMVSWVTIPYFHIYV